MMGAGKSAVGEALARRLGRGFVDGDAEVERLAGMTIPEIFEREGEAGFRARERAVLDALAGQPLVVALGGGAIAQPGAAERLLASGTVIWLRARPASLLERVGEGEGRPLLQGLDSGGRLARLRELLARREPHYARAQIVVDTDDAGPEQIAAALAARLEAAA
jgi:shikimate kinase